MVRGAPSPALKFIQPKKLNSQEQLHEIKRKHLGYLYIT